MHIKCQHNAESYGDFEAVGESKTSGSVSSTTVNGDSENMPSSASSSVSSKSLSSPSSLHHVNRYTHTPCLKMLTSDNSPISHSLFLSLGDQWLNFACVLQILQDPNLSMLLNRRNETRQPMSRLCQTDTQKRFPNTYFITFLHHTQIYTQWHTFTHPQKHQTTPT